jgi:hypothetical protein
VTCCCAVATIMPPLSLNFAGRNSTDDVPK